MKYNMVEIVLPNEDYVDRASTKINGHWAWIADYASCARKLQLALYGETNIVLEPNRTTALDLLNNVNSGENSGSSNNSSDSGHSDSTSADYSYTYEDESDSSTETTRSDTNEPSYTLPTIPSLTIPSIPIPSITLTPGDNSTETQPSSADDSENND